MYKLVIIAKQRTVNDSIYLFRLESYLLIIQIIDLSE